MSLPWGFSKRYCQAARFKRRHRFDLWLLNFCWTREETTDPLQTVSFRPVYPERDVACFCDVDMTDLLPYLDWSVWWHWRPTCGCWVSKGCWAMVSPTWGCCYDSVVCWTWMLNPPPSIRICEKSMNKKLDTDAFKRKEFELCWCLKRSVLRDFSSDTNPLFSTFYCHFQRRKRP